MTFTLEAYGKNYWKMLKNKDNTDGKFTKLDMGYTLANVYLVSLFDLKYLPTKEININTSILIM